MRYLVTARIADVIPKTQGVLAMTTGLGHQVDDRVDALGRHQRARVAGMPAVTPASIRKQMDSPAKHVHGERAIARKRAWTDSSKKRCQKASGKAPEQL